MRKRQYGHRQFLKWLRTERRQFLNPPVITSSGYDRTEFLFEGIHRSIRGYYKQQSRTYSQISVWVKWEETNIDFIFDLDLKEKCGSDSHSCSLCLPEHCINYPERSELLVKHSFEPFLEWCNETLSASSWLAIFNYKDHWSEAKLTKTNSDAKLQKYTFVRNPFYLDSKSGNDWTLNPVSTGQ